VVTPPTDIQNLTKRSFIQEIRRWKARSALPLVVLAYAVALAALRFLPDAVAVALAGFLLIGQVSLVASEAGPTGTRLWVALTSAVFALGLVLGGTVHPIAVWAIFPVFAISQTELIGRASRQLRRAATTDPMTGLDNWNGLLWHMGVLIPTCRRLGVPVTVVLIDLDDFKEFNDREGHAAGDRILRTCADAWRRGTRAEDVLARIGGDEFLLVMPGATPGEAIGTIERLRQESPVGWSHGAVQLAPDEDLDGCLVRADAELYKSKASRREDSAAPEGVDARPYSVPGGTG